MQFREHNKEIQCIRSIYDYESRRIHQKVVAAFPRYLEGFPSPDFLVDLTNDERKELGVWWSERQAHFMADIEKWRAKWAGATLVNLAKAIENYRDMTVEETAAAWSGLIKVARVLKSRASEMECAQSGNRQKPAETCEPGESLTTARFPKDTLRETVNFGQDRTGQE